MKVQPIPSELEVDHEGDMTHDLEEPDLNWSRQDIEQRLGFRGGSFTEVNSRLSFLVALAIGTLVYGIVYVIGQISDFGKVISGMLFGHGLVVPITITLLFFWCLTMLFFKARKVRYQRQALMLSLVPQQPEFVLNTSTAEEVLERAGRLVDDTNNFILLNRIQRALSNLRNIGRIGDVAEILALQADQDRDQMDSSYTLINGFVWAMPVVGFIGTVLGLSAAIGSFGSVLDAGSSDMAALTGSLKQVTSGLSTAFETTLLALIASLIVQIRVTFLQKEEAAHLEACNDYCHRHVVAKLRIDEQATHPRGNES